jgi:hypothetical protein
MRISSVHPSLVRRVAMLQMAFQFSLMEAPSSA